jgi:prepilin-type processing-associated H-X9-DG protein
MKQYALAVHNFHDSQQELPLSQGLLHSVRLWGPTTFLLPYMEQQARYDANLAETGTWDPHVLRAPIQGGISMLRCTSDIGSKTASGTITKTSIMFSLGDAINDNANLTSTGVGSRSAFVTDSAKTLASITDGTSNTILVSETIVADDSQDREAGMNAMNGIGSLDTNPRQCLDYLNPNDRSFLRSTYTYSQVTTVSNTYNQMRGFNAYRCVPNHGAFCTVLPPNTASCSSGNYTAGGVYTASSRHPGGVNAAFFDGSAKFIVSEINCISAGITIPVQVTSGASQFGVWGALGSINGDEAVTP